MHDPAIAHSAQLVHLPAAARASQPWKNGGGTTTTVAVWPAGAALDAVGWRLSLAEVAGEGPFSSFPGIDRHLAMLAGAMELRFADRAVRLDPASPALAFAGEAPVLGVPLGGPARDCNLMVDRTRFAGRLERVVGPVRLVPRPGCHQLLLVLDAAPASPGLPALAPLDALWLGADSVTGTGTGAGTEMRVPAGGWLATITPR